MRTVTERIARAKGLEQLADVLRQATVEELQDVDLSDLPTYGGEEVDREGVFSWDADDLLISTGSLEHGGWEIVPR